MQRFFKSTPTSESNISPCDLYFIEKARGKSTAELAPLKQTAIDYVQQNRRDSSITAGYFINLCLGANTGIAGPVLQNDILARIEQDALAHVQQKYADLLPAQELPHRYNP